MGTCRFGRVLGPALCGSDAGWVGGGGGVVLECSVCFVYNTLLFSSCRCHGVPQRFGTQTPPQRSGSRGRVCSVHAWLLCPLHDRHMSVLHAVNWRLGWFGGRRWTFSSVILILLLFPASSQVPPPPVRRTPVPTKASACSSGRDSPAIAP